MDDESRFSHGVPPPPPPSSSSAPPADAHIGRPLPAHRADIVAASGSRPPLLRAQTMVIVGGVLVLVLVLGLTGMSLLGSDDSEEPAPAAAVAAASTSDDKKDRFVAKGDRLCKRATRAQERLLYPDSPAQFADYLERVRGMLVGLIKDLKKLPRPKQDAALLKRMFTKVDKLPPVLSQARAAAVAGDFSSVERIVARGEKIEHQANALALQYGFAECSQP